MNPRLQQLALEHGYLRWDEDSQSYELDGGVDAMYAFAELVVGKATDVVYDLLDDNTGAEVVVRVKEHFGVDE